MQQKVVPAAAPVIDTSDMDPELARYLNRNYWQQKSVELKSSATSATVTQPSAPAIVADTKVSTAGGGGLNNSAAVPQQNAEDEVVTVTFCLLHSLTCTVARTGFLATINFLLTDFGPLQTSGC